MKPTRHVPTATAYTEHISIETGIEAPLFDADAQTASEVATLALFDQEQARLQSSKCTWRELVNGTLEATCAKAGTQLDSAGGHPMCDEHAALMMRGRYCSCTLDKFGRSDR